MKKNKKEDELRARGVFNEHFIAVLGTKLYIFKRSERLFSRAWMVARTDKKFHSDVWSDYGHKNFGTGDDGLQAAIRFVMKLNGGLKMVRSPLSRDRWVCADDLALAFALPVKDNQKEREH